MGLRNLVVSLRRDCEIARSALSVEKRNRSALEGQMMELETKLSDQEKARAQAEKELAELRSLGDMRELLQREAESHRLLQVYTESNNALRKELDENQAKLAALNATTEQQQQQQVQTNAANEQLRKQLQAVKQEMEVLRGNLVMAQQQAQQAREQAQQAQQQVQQAQQQAQASQQGAQQSGAASSGKPEDDVVDADYKEVKH